jgi:hypothetical protein
MPFQRLQTVAGHETTISDHNNKNEPATLLFLSFFLSCLFACFVSLLFLSSLPSAANKGPPSRLQQQQLLLQQQKELHLQETLQTRSGAKPRRRPIAASASCATAMGKKPSEIRQKETPKRKAFVPSVQRYFFFPANGVFWFEGGGGSSCPLLQKDRKVPEKNWNLHPHFTLGVKANVQLKSSISIGAKNMKSAPQGLYTRSQV